MQIIKPIVHETIWGGKKLTQYSDSKSENIGHLYSCIDTKNFKSEIIWGTFSGKNIHDWFLDNRDKYGMSQYDELPVLMALVEAADNLSIQVHPDDKNAALLEGKPFGKNESFYILEPPEKGYMFNGCRCDSKEEFAKMIDEGRCLEGVDTLELNIGDYVYIKAGTLHAASKGSLSFEIEENCDATYRFYDFDRLDKKGNKRSLQVTNALQCLNVKNKSIVRRYEKNNPIVERIYSSEYIKDRESFLNEEDSFIIAVMLKGQKIVHNKNILPGTAIIVEPNDTLELSGCEWIFIRIINKLNH